MIENNVYPIHCLRVFTHCFGFIAKISTALVALLSHTYMPSFILFLRQNEKDYVHKHELWSFKRSLKGFPRDAVKALEHTVRNWTDK